MRESCINYCPVYAECESKRRSLANAQHELVKEQGGISRVIDDDLVSDTIVPILPSGYEIPDYYIDESIAPRPDLLYDAAKVELEVTSRLQYCSGPRLGMIGKSLIRFSQAFNWIFSDNNPIDLPQFIEKLTKQHAACPNKQARKVLKFMPKVVHNRMSAPPPRVA